MSHRTGEDSAQVVGAPATASEPILRVDGVDLAFGGVKALRRFSEEVRAGELFAIIGPIAHHGYVLESGKVVLEGPTERLRGNPDVREFYLGLTELGARRSYRDVRHYRRRKRWLS
jgi:ABC-type uncharacterized transport system ATPase subunit